MHVENNGNQSVILLGSLGVTFEKWLPYATGCLISRCLHSHQLEGYRFATPLYKNLSQKELLHRLADVDILGLTCYVWNQSLNSHISRTFKSLRPEGRVIWGGPNIPKQADALRKFAQSHPHVDHFVTGMGETAFHDLLVNLKSSGTADRLLCSTDQQLLPENRGNPYLDGVFENILSEDRDLKASFETNRGCPYKCSFCDWGGQAGSRIRPIEMEEVEQVIDYLYSKPTIREIEILDANFGMFKRDREIVDLMVHYKRKHGTNPSVSYSGLAKNGSPFLPQIIRTIETELNSRKHQLKISFQSHSQETLADNHRENIKNEKLIRLMTSLREQQDVEVASELIIGLPGDTPERFRDSLATDISLGISNSRAYILSVSDNTTLKDPEFIKKHQLKFKTIRFPESFSRWSRQSLLENEKPSLAETPVAFEEHHLVYESNSLNLQGLKKTFLYWWFHHTFYNARGLFQSLAYLIHNGHSYETWLDEFLVAAQNQPTLAQQMNRIRTMTESIFEPEAVTTINDFNIYTFMAGPLRTVEIHELLKDRRNVQEFLIRHFKKCPFPEQVLVFLEQDLKSWGTPESVPVRKQLGLLARLSVTPVVHGYPVQQSL